MITRKGKEVVLGIAMHKSEKLLKFSSSGTSQELWE